MKDLTKGSDTGSCVTTVVCRDWNTCTRWYESYGPSCPQWFEASNYGSRSEQSDHTPWSWRFRTDSPEVPSIQGRCYAMPYIVSTRLFSSGLITRTAYGFFSGSWEKLRKTISPSTYSTATYLIDNRIRAGRVWSDRFKLIFVILSHLQIVWSLVRRRISSGSRLFASVVMFYETLCCTIIC